MSRNNNRIDTFTNSTRLVVSLVNIYWIFHRKVCNVQYNYWCWLYLIADGCPSCYPSTKRFKTKWKTQNPLSFVYPYTIYNWTGHESGFSVEYLMSFKGPWSTGSLCAPMSFVLNLIYCFPATLIGFAAAKASGWPRAFKTGKSFFITFDE